MTETTLPRRAFLLGATAALAACSTSKPAPPAARHPQDAGATASRTPAPPPPSQEKPPRFIRPADGPVIGIFNGKQNKGIDYGGKAGDPVRASADGQVVYVGSQLRGYGQIVIIKHDESYLSAYAHNRTVLVKEKDKVRQNQPIAEMGRTGTDRVKLHFEIRKKGVAVDPQPLLDGNSH